MLRVRDIRLSIDHTPEDLKAAVLRSLRVPEDRLLSYHVVHRAVDARNKARILFVYSLDADVLDQTHLLSQNRPGVSALPAAPVVFPASKREISFRPVIVGTGPAGLFAGLWLARSGTRPLLLERGKTVEERIADVSRFFSGGPLNPESNVQFGEGGAGTFSDGKLNTLINDPYCRTVLEELASAGAPPEILHVGKPHVGTDQLRGAVKGLRRAVLEAGGEFRFDARVEDLALENGRIAGVVLAGGERVETKAVLLAVGNAARDTFDMLRRRGVRMEAKPFSIGLRIEHPRELIDRAQFGGFAGHPRLGTADYKMAHQAANGRGCYTFCMCPGGVVVAGASEPGGVVTNGMSDFARLAPNSNSALMVGVAPADFGGEEDPLAGVAFQRLWERKAFTLGGSDFRAPAQTVGDFLARRVGSAWGNVRPSYQPGVVPADLRECLPDVVIRAIEETLPVFTRRLKGFASPDALLTGVETRSSSPVRLLRDDRFESSLPGLFPAGEGAGYAGGIMSSAVDGLRAAQALLAAAENVK